MKKITLPFMLFISVILGACGKNQVPRAVTEQPSQSSTISQGEEFSIAKVEAKLDEMGVTDPALRKHMLGVAVYYAHEAGETLIEPTVKPLTSPSSLTSQAVNRNVADTIAPFSNIPLPASIAYWQYNTTAQNVINLYGSAYYSGFCTPTSTDNDMVQIFYGTTFRDKVYSGATVYGRRSGLTAVYYSGHGIRVFNDGYTHLCKGFRWAELSELYTRP